MQGTEPPGRGGGAVEAFGPAEVTLLESRVHAESLVQTPHLHFLRNRRRGGNAEPHSSPGAVAEESRHFGFSRNPCVSIS